MGSPGVARTSRAGKGQFPVALAQDHVQVTCTVERADALQQVVAQLLVLQWFRTGDRNLEQLYREPGRRFDLGGNRPARIVDHDGGAEQQHRDERSRDQDVQSEAQAHGQRCPGAVGGAAVICPL